MESSLICEPQLFPPIPNRFCSACYGCKLGLVQGTNYVAAGKSIRAINIRGSASDVLCGNLLPGRLVRQSRSIPPADTSSSYAYTLCHSLCGFILCTKSIMESGAQKAVFGNFSHVDYQANGFISSCNAGYCSSIPISTRDPAQPHRCCLLIRVRLLTVCWFSCLSALFFTLLLLLLLLLLLTSGHFIKTRGSLLVVETLLNSAFSCRKWAKT
jgi:hypothetical protein